MTQILEQINQIVWGAPALILILGVGLYLTLRSGLAQLTLFPAALRAFISRFTEKKTDTSGGVSPYQALCTALAATVGTGNLAGVAGAIAIGGPGAVFWMWVCAFFGMVTKFAEATLAVRYRVKSGNGEWIGGPMHMIEQGMGARWKWLGSIYCFFAVVAAFGVGNATQINTVIGGINSVMSAFGVQSSGTIDLIVGICLAILISMILAGGARRIGSLAERLVPFAAAAYLLLCFGVLAMRAPAVPQAFVSIFEGAFDPVAVTGGMLGSAFRALRVGASRGVFTNEAGMGTASIAHASANVKHPVEQGLMGIMEVFLDTIVICTMTALVILCSGVAIPYGIDNGAVLTTNAFSHVYGDWVSVVIALALCAFAIATVLGWGLYGARCAQYLFGEKAWRPFVALQAVAVVAGAVVNTQTVWTLSETVNGMMAIPNLIMLACLSPELIRLLKEYKRHLGAAGTDGGTYENIDQCKSLRAVTYAQISPPRSGGRKERKEDLSSEYRSA